ncbi:aflatoxin B1 aldehyde reductase [Phyllosticta citricarpa]|uniref:Aflatoxin B1 aldehyde reductase n=2 Tax=Phyllosticta TaxID=121621 RepID=A0ABR1M279_9PEZI
MPFVVQRPKPRSSGARLTSLEAYTECLDRFQSQGYNEIDTARVHVGGKQESFTAAAKWKERGLALATKCYPVEPGLHKRENITASLTKSLGELQMDCVDIFNLHAADRSVPFAETLEAVNDLHKQGKFVQLSLSNFTAFEVAEVVMTCKANGEVRPTIYQAMYNVFTRSIEAELIPACRRYALDIVVYNPLAGGIVSEKYKSSDVPDSGRFSESVGRMGANCRSRYFKDATWDALRIIEPVVQKHNLTLLETAFRWVVHHSALNMKNGNDGVIVGISSLEQLKENLRDLKKVLLSDEVARALDEAWFVTHPTTANYWHLDLKYTYDTVKALFG